MSHPGAIPTPHVIVGDEAFPLKTYLTRPYPEKGLSEDRKIFNYRLSRARRVVENTFGILAARWRIYHRRIQMHSKILDYVIKATCVLHNFLQQNTTGIPGMDAVSSDESENPGSGMFQELRNQGRRHNNATIEAFSVREKFKEYFLSPTGQVEWQRNVVRRGLPH